ncbi:MAG: phosphatidate cytidylyltransferase [Bacteroidetes bacterium]|nr:phosphatidate cytidylyltransferase [Bacteroidota bacterium]
MFKLNKFYETYDLLIVIAIIFGVLLFVTLLFYLRGLKTPGGEFKELSARTKSWWVMAALITATTIFNPIVPYICFAFISFITYRELISISKNVRESDRHAIAVSFLSIPVQYYLAYKGYYTLFLVFIPIFMHVLIPFLLVLRGDLVNIARAMAVLPGHLMLTVFSISHMAYLLSLPDLPGVSAGSAGLVLFVVSLTEINDIFQYTWGSLFGRFKMMKKTNIHKTWEGFIGGILLTILAGYWLRFLTPFSEKEAIVISFILAILGFVGDIIGNALKQEMGVTDPNATLSKKGVMIDRIDSLAISAPVFFHIVYQLYYAK